MKVDMNNRESDVQIEILPMIDVIFCILTFFILAAVGLSRQQALDIALPSVSNSTPLVGDGTNRAYVSVDSIGQTYFERTPVTLSELQGYLFNEKQTKPDVTFVLYASSSARYEDVLKVLDLLRTIGGDRVSLATLPTGASLDPTQGATPLPSQPQGQPQPGGLGQPIPGAPNTFPGAPSNPFPAGQFPAGQFPADGTSPGGIRTTPAPNGGGSGNSFPNGTLPPVPGAPEASPPADSPATP
jgi:biopolymer transport protein ExbD